MKVVSFMVTCPKLFLGEISVKDVKVNSPASDSPGMLLLDGNLISLSVSRTKSFTFGRDWDCVVGLGVISWAIRGKETDHEPATRVAKASPLQKSAEFFFKRSRNDRTS